MLGAWVALSAARQASRSCRSSSARSGVSGAGVVSGVLFMVSKVVERIRFERIWLVRHSPHKYNPLVETLKVGKRNPGLQPASQPVNKFRCAAARSVITFCCSLCVLMPPGGSSVPAGQFYARIHNLIQSG